MVALIDGNRSRKIPVARWESSTCYAEEHPIGWQIIVQSMIQATANEWRDLQVMCKVDGFHFKTEQKMKT